MVKKACYIILSNAFLFQNYGTKKDRVFKDDTLKWKEVDFVSGYWDSFENEVSYNYQGILKKLTNIMVDLLEDSCSYHLDRHKFFCEILHNMKIGETVFVKYEDETKLVLKEHLKHKHKHTKIVESNRINFTWDPTTII